MEINVNVNLNEGTDTILDRLDTLMENGIVEFMYMKKDGSLRKAIGTRNNEVIKEITNGEKSLDKSMEIMIADSNKGLERYFDLERNCVRTYKRRATLACNHENVDIKDLNLED